MRQLCLAVGGLEKIGLAHGDIRPGNMLLDADWNLKMSDFERAMNIGEEIVVLTEPFGRLLWQSRCSDRDFCYWPCLLQPAPWS